MAAALLALKSLAGFAHAVRTPKNQAFAAPDVVPEKSGDKQLAGV